MRLAGRAVLVALALLGCDAIRAPHVSRSTILVSSTPSGRAATGLSHHPWISDDGQRVAFISNATNLVADQALGFGHVYVKNRNDNSILLATRNSDALDVPEIANPTEVALSGNGRYVAFTSSAALDNGFPAAGGTQNIFVRDLELNTTRRALNKAMWPLADLTHPAVADNGYVVFSTTANLGFGGVIRSIYLSDTTKTPPTVILISHVPGMPTTPVNDDSDFPWISADGQTICFVSWAGDISPDDPDPAADVYVVKLNAGVPSDPTLVSRNSGVAGTKGNAASFDPHLSPDGQFVAYVTMATNLAPGSFSNVMVRNLTTHETTCVTVTSDTLGPDAHVTQPRINRGGARVVFLSAATNLTGNTSGLIQPYLTLPAGGFEQVSVSDTGALGNLDAQNPSISSVGPWVVWSSFASNLVVPDSNGWGDIFARGPYGP